MMHAAVPRHAASFASHARRRLFQAIAFGACPPAAESSIASRLPPPFGDGAARFQRAVGGSMSPVSAMPCSREFHVQLGVVAICALTDSRTMLSG